MNCCVVTTINNPTKAIEQLYERFGDNLIIAGDKKTPADWSYKNVSPIPDLIKLYSPNNHYAKKNIGYLSAIEKGATVIYDTDDDNIPNDNWAIREYECIAEGINSGDWTNILKKFSDEFIWPRGFPLAKTSIDVGFLDNIAIKRKSSIQQGLADGDADVDAIWRISLGKQVTFSKQQSISLYPYSWCPFNSQSTWWFPKAYPLMYLPVYASFRMTDIWRSFVAQRCLWEIG